MRTLKFLLIKEFSQIFRNPSILRMIFIMPIFELLILPLAADYEIKNINISIVDHDHSTYSRQLIAKITCSEYFKLTDYNQSYMASFTNFETDKSDLILAIPEGFERNLVRDNQNDLFLAVNAINGVKANVGSAYVSRIIADFNNEIRLKWIDPTIVSSLPRIEITTANWYNPLLNYQFFMVPGILVVLVTMVGAYMCALNIVKEREVGTIEQINVTPIKKYHFLLGKLIPFWIIGIVIFTIGLMGISRLVYGIIPEGSLWVIYSFLSVFLIAVLGVGLLISTYSNTQQQAMTLAFFAIMIFILMGGLYTTIESMPRWAQWIAWFNPATYFIDLIRMVIMKGSGFYDLRKHFLIMAGFAFFFNIWAIMKYRKTN